MDDFYADKKKVIEDFWLGFFCAIVMTLFLFFGCTIIFGWMGIYSDFLFFVLTAIVLVIGIIYFFKTGRRYLSIGILTSLFGPLLLFGACVSMFW